MILFFNRYNAFLIGNLPLSSRIRKAEMNRIGQVGKAMDGDGDAGRMETPFAETAS